MRAERAYHTTRGRDERAEIFKELQRHLLLPHTWGDQ